jgi:hypothetical protein
MSRDALPIATRRPVSRKLGQCGPSTRATDNNSL